ETAYGNHVRPIVQKHAKLLASAHPPSLRRDAVDVANLVGAVGQEILVADDVPVFDCVTEQFRCAGARHRAESHGRRRHVARYIYATATLHSQPVGSEHVLASAGGKRQRKDWTVVLVDYPAAELSKAMIARGRLNAVAQTDRPRISG